MPKNFNTDSGSHYNVSNVERWNNLPAKIWLPENINRLQRRSTSFYQGLGGSAFRARVNTTERPNYSIELSQVVQHWINSGIINIPGASDDTILTCADVLTCLGPINPGTNTTVTGDYSTGWTINALTNCTEVQACIPPPTAGDNMIITGTPATGFTFTSVTDCAEVLNCLPTIVGTNGTSVIGDWTNGWTINSSIEVEISGFNYNPATNELQITETNGDILSVSLASLVDMYSFTVADSTCMDLTIQGDGTTNPWLLTANPIIAGLIPGQGANTIECSSTGLFSRKDYFQGALNGCVAIGLTGEGSILDPYTFTPQLRIDPIASNALVCGTDGLSVTVPAQTTTSVSATDSTCIDLTVTPTTTGNNTDYAVTASPIISSTTGNQLVCSTTAGEEGLFVPAASNIFAAIPVTPADPSNPSADINCGDYEIGQFLSWNASGVATDPYDYLYQVVDDGTGSCTIQIIDKPVQFVDIDEDCNCCGEEQENTQSLTISDFFIDGSDLVHTYVDEEGAVHRDEISCSDLNAMLNACEPHVIDILNPDGTKMTCPLVFPFIINDGTEIATQVELDTWATANRPGYTFNGADCTYVNPLGGDENDILTGEWLCDLSTKYCRINANSTLLTATPVVTVHNSTSGIVKYTASNGTVVTYSYEGDAAMYPNATAMTINGHQVDPVISPVPTLRLTLKSIVNPINEFSKVVQVRTNITDFDTGGGAVTSSSLFDYDNHYYFNVGGNMINVGGIEWQISSPNDNGGLVGIIQTEEIQNYNSDFEVQIAENLRTNSTGDSLSFQIFVLTYEYAKKCYLSNSGMSISRYVDEAGNIINESDITCTPFVTQPRIN